MKFPAFAPIDLKHNNTDIEIIELPLSKIIPDPNQPRKNFTDNSLIDLSLSIQKHGIIQPIIVKKIDNEQYQIIAGERRWRASKMAELQTITAIVKEHDEQKNFAISLIENIQREQLNPIELAKALYRLSNEYGLSHESIAAIIGKNRVTVTHALRLLHLPAYIQDLLIDGTLETGHAKALLTLSPDMQRNLIQRIINEKLTVRETEKFAKNTKLYKDENITSSKLVDQWIKNLTEKLSSKVCMKMNNKGEGKIIIHFGSFDEIGRIMSLFEK